ncbi:hypothetical protein HGRIS_006205 [Hohenbuehelia grisea]|uniref:Hydrophobin n=1 Tax=Hohenbuehelia grisea TaxID=104357 RepID=A0ABR3JZG6_9AGAR
MFAVVLAALAATAFAASVPAQADDCSARTGTQMCCNYVGKHTDPKVVTGLAQSGILGLNLIDLVGDIALGCVASGCKQQAVCCKNAVTASNGLSAACNAIAL